MSKFTPIKKALFAGVLTLAPLAASAADVTLRMAHVVREGDPAYKACELFKSKVESMTDGRVEVKIFPAAQLGNNRKLFTQIQSGAIDLSLTPLNLLADIVPPYSVTSAGYMFDDWSQLERVLDAPEFGQKWSKELLEKGGLRPLSYIYYGTRDLTTADTPVHTPADLKGLKIRAVPNPISLANITGIGASPTPVAWSETYQALSQGVVDGQENPIPVLYSANLFEVQHYLIKTHHQMSALPILIRESSFQKLSAADQAAVSKAAVIAAQAGTDETIKFTASLEDALVKKGMEVIDLNPQERQMFKEAVQYSLAETVDGDVLPAGLIGKVNKFISEN